MFTALITGQLIVDVFFQSVIPSLMLGSSRGIGLGVVKEFLRKPNFRVVATARNPSASTSLQELLKQYGSERLLVLPLDVTSAESHTKLKESLLSQGINSVDILLANAGVATARNNALTATAEIARADFETNVIGTILTFQAFADLVFASRLKIFSVTSSILGSIASTAQTGAGVSTYRVSKAALNMYVAGFTVDAEVGKKGGKSLIIHPGWVQTDMGGPAALITVQQSSEGIINLFDIATAIQLNSEITVPPEYKSYHETLRQNPLAYAVYNGDLLPW